MSTAASTDMNLSAATSATATAAAGSASASAATSAPTSAPTSAQAGTSSGARGQGTGSSVPPLKTILLRFRKEVIWVAVFGVFSNLLMLTPTLYMMQVFDRVMVSNSEYTLAALSLLAVALFLVMGFADWARSRLLVRVGTRFDLMAQREVFIASFDAKLRSTTGANPQALNDLTVLRQFLTGNGIYAAVDTPWVFVFAGALYLIHPWLGYTALAFVVLMLGVAVIGSRLLAPRAEKAQAAQVDSNTYLAGKLRNSETVEAFGMLKHLRRRWLSIHDRQSDLQTRAQEATHRLQTVTKFVQYAQQSLVLALGAVLAIGGHISAGAMLACNALMGNALRPIGLAAGSWSQFVEARAAYRRINKLLEENPPRAGASDDLPELKGQVSVRGLWAKAPARKDPILKGLDLDFRAGEVVAIVGPSGAGKSTLARCLMGIWPDTEGEVLLDGTPLRAWSREAIGARMGYLPQDIELFDGTIEENIARFTDGQEKLVIDAARRTGIHDMVLRMPQGYDTPMGEAGGSLSGGQRQRIGLARAIFGHPVVVVLDEPNANLDDAGEAALVNAVRDLKSRGTTVFMIVHQQSLLTVADRVLFLENGQATRLVPLVAQNQAQANPGVQATASSSAAPAGQNEIVARTGPNTP
jgi:ATP-binding cassette subfamily C exporter for protease/lipase